MLGEKEVFLVLIRIDLFIFFFLDWVFMEYFISVVKRWVVIFEVDDF